MGLTSTITSGGGTDWSKYTITSGSTVIGSSNYTTVLSVTGAGYISHVVGVPTISSTNNNIFVRVTVDNVVKVATGQQASNTIRRACGMMSNKSIFYSATIDEATIVASTYRDLKVDHFNLYPYTGAAVTGGIVLIPDSIFFKTSLLIEGRSDNSDGSIYYLIGTL